MGSTSKPNSDHEMNEKEHRTTTRGRKNGVGNIAAFINSATSDIKEAHKKEYSQHGDSDIVCASAETVCHNQQRVRDSDAGTTAANWSSDSEQHPSNGEQVETNEVQETAEATNIVNMNTNAGKRVMETMSDDAIDSQEQSAERQKRKWSRFESLQDEYVRLLTFENWPEDKQFIEPQELAKAGFFYLKKDDIVQCAFCRGMVGLWEENDVPILEHKRHFPWCVFAVKGVAVSDSESRPVQSMSSTYDTVSRYVQEPNTLQLGDSSDLLKNFNVITKFLDQRENLKSLRITQVAGPHYAEYVSRDVRLSTFSSWPLSQPLPMQLADAGFFYANLSDHVRCFYCNGGLRNWKPEDDPWLEHARWFPSCQFVQLSKREHFYQLAEITDDSPMTETVASVVSPQITINASIPLNDTRHQEAPDVTDELQEENRRLREAYTCKICLDKEVGVVFLPCGHLVACVQCAPAVSKCPMCRQIIRGMARTYLN